MADTALTEAAETTDDVTKKGVTFTTADGAQAQKSKDANVVGNEAEADAQQELTDGFHLVIDALKLNGINTIYGVPGIPITDLGRMCKPKACA